MKFHLLKIGRLPNLFFVLFFLCFSILKMDAQRTCSTHDMYLEQVQNDPHRAQIKNQIEQEIQAYISQYPNGSPSRSVITIPVVFHVFHDGDAVGTDENISDALIQAQLDQLNLDFSASNTDFSNIPTEFQGVAADTEIQFCLASKDPSGGSTSGILRYDLGDPSYTKSDLTGVYMPFLIWDRDDYLNIFTCRFGSPDAGLLGFAQLPGGSSDSDAVALSYKTVGSMLTPNPDGFPYNLGRTATHEIGHWLNLEHIWGDDAGACSGSDFVADTPNQASNYGGCPSHPQTSCTSNDMFMNYMDYVNDNCMIMFTSGQKLRMEATLNGTRSSILTSSATNCNLPIAEINFITASGSLMEGGACGVNTVVLEASISAAPTSNVTVTIGLTGSTASNGVDFNMSTFSLVFPSGSTANQSVTITGIDDINFETTEQINLTLSTSSSDATIGTEKTRTVDIFDNDVNPDGSNSTVHTSTNVSSGGEAELGPMATIHFHDPSTGNLMCTVQNLTNHDYGCTTVEVDRAGVASERFVNNDVNTYLHSKTFKITPTTNNTIGIYNVTVYFTDAEVDGWESTTIYDRTDTWIHKVSGDNSIDDVTPSNSTSYVVNTKTATSVAFGTTGVAYTAQFNTGFSGFGVGVSNSFLPVELIGFDGRHINNEKNQLTWITESELNSSHFEVERSSDLENFEKIGTVEAAGNSTENITYHFDDANYPYGISYYRLKMIDLDGTFEYSPTIQISVKEQNENFIYPNPSTGKFIISFDDIQEQEMNFSVWNIANQLVLQQEGILLNARFHEIDLSNVQDGIYFIKMGSGSRSKSYKVVKISK